MQRFNKALQDLFLPVVESGLISLIASTTENPSFRVNGALLSRCRVFVLEKLDGDALYRILLRALKVLKETRGSEDIDLDVKLGKGKDPVKNEEGFPNQPSMSSAEGTPGDATLDLKPAVDESILSHYPFLDSSLLRFLAAAADGDARVALSSLELALSATKGGTSKVDREELKRGLRKAHLQYDRAGGKLSYSTIPAADPR